MGLLDRPGESEKASIRHSHCLTCKRGGWLLGRPRNLQPIKGPMKKISELFTDEEREQLSYLGSMLRSEPTRGRGRAAADLRRNRQRPGGRRDEHN
jgi:hypothetical protein